MSWKDILVFADGSGSGLARAMVAADLSRAVGAELEICVPICLPALSEAGGVDFTVELFDEIEHDAREDAGRISAELRSRLPDLAQKYTVISPEVRMPDVPKLVGQLGQSCDLVVVGQPISADASRVDDDVIDGALFRSGRPCLMLPRQDAPRTVGKRALIAWKDVPEAARAVAGAMPLLQRAEEVTVVAVGHGTRVEQSMEHSLARLHRHLARYEVKAEMRSVLTDGAAGEEILEYASSLSADLLVMGAFGHSRFRELIFGGATRTAIRQSPVPVLMCH